MDAEQILFDGLKLTVLFAGVPVVSMLLLGLGVSVLQAATQIQDQSLSFVPKLISIMLVVALLLPWLMDRLIAYSTTMFSTPIGF